jgi:hypothetical protein
MLRNFGTKQRGAVMIIVVIGMVALLAMAGLALDSSHAMLNKTRLQNSVDAAALSGAKQLDLSGDTGEATTAAINAFNANGSAAGNGELGNSIASGDINLEIQFSETLNPFIPGTVPAEYIRVRARNFRLPAWFTNVVGLSEKVVAASAVAGPSPTIDTACNIAPMMVCGDPAAGGPYWGYEEGKPDVLKMSDPMGNADPTCGDSVGPGNFQLIRLGDNTGAADLRLAMAGGYDGCAGEGDSVQTEPGNTVGPVYQGLNTRFGVYDGSMKGTEAIYPPDVITAQPPQPLSYDNDAYTDPVTGEAVDEQACPSIKQSGVPIESDADLTYNYDDYTTAMLAKNFDEPLLGQYLRREVAIPIGDCTGTTNGAGEVPILGFACFFLLQEAGGSGNDSYVFGQFIRDCNAAGIPGPDPGDAPGLYLIQLYKDPDSPEA